MVMLNIFQWDKKIAQLETLLSYKSFELSKYQCVPVTPDSQCWGGRDRNFPKVLWVCIADEVSGSM